MVELARLESVYRGNPIKGSNPFSSATDFCFVIHPVFNLMDDSIPLFNQVNFNNFLKIILFFTTLN